MTGNRSTDLGHFDRAYARSADPWSTLTSAYEREKTALAVASLPRLRYGSALDVGCGVGALTEALAVRADRVVGLDGSAAVVHRTAERLAHLAHVTVRRVVLPPGRTAELGAPFDLGALSEVGYYLAPDDLATTADAVVAALSPGADLLLVHWLHDHPDHRVTGDEVHEAFIAHPALEAVSGSRHTLYGNSFRIDVLRRTSTSS